LINFLLNQSINPDQPDIYDVTPFSYLITTYDSEKDPQVSIILDELHKRNVKIDSPNENGFTPFLFCFEKGKFEMAFKLLDFGADINYKEPKSGNFALKYSHIRK
jgi:ankyrin repeat protein